MFTDKRHNTYLVRFPLPDQVWGCPPWLSEGGLQEPEFHFPMMQSPFGLHLPSLLLKARTRTWRDRQTKGYRTKGQQLRDWVLDLWWCAITVTWHGHHESVQLKSNKALQLGRDDFNCLLEAGENRAKPECPPCSKEGWNQLWKQNESRENNIFTRSIFTFTSFFFLLSILNYHRRHICLTSKATLIADFSM